MRLFKLKGYDLYDVFGNDAKNMKEDTIMVYGKHQMYDTGEKISYGYMSDDYSIDHVGITYFDSIDDLNADIDAEYKEIFILKDVQELQVDMLLSGNPTIEGYDANSQLRSQSNLKALYEANMGGVVKNKKADYFK